MFPMYPAPSFDFDYYNFCLDIRGVLCSFKREGANSEKYKLSYFQMSSFTVLIYMPSTVVQSKKTELCIKKEFTDSLG